MKSRLLNILLLSLFLLPCCAEKAQAESTEEEKHVPDKPLKILFIGNSHTLDATYLLPQMLNAQGIRDVEMVRCYHGGYYLVGYNSHFDQPGICAINTWRSGQNFWRGTLELESSLKDALEYCQYDIVVMQEYAGSSYCWDWTSTEKNAIKGLVDKIHAASPNAEIVYFLSHCFAKGLDKLVQNFGDSNEAQFRTCVENNAIHVMDPAEGFGIKKIISTAALLQNLRTTALNVDNGTDLCRGDKVHLDYGLSRFAAAALLWKMLITPATGIPADQIIWRYKEFLPKADGQYSTPAIDDNFKTVMAAVDAAFEKPLESTDLSSYSSVPHYTNAPGSVMLDQTGVDPAPCTFPVSFPVAYGDNTTLTQPYWNAYAVFLCRQQPQAFAKWVNVSRPVEGMTEKHDWSASQSGDWSTVAIDAVWTGDYIEFVIPAANIPAGATIRIAAPVYSVAAPCFWYLDYLDGNEWKTNHSTVTAPGGQFSCDATFCLKYGRNDVRLDVTLSKPVTGADLRFRIRCADGSVQTASGGYVKRDKPYIKDGAYAGRFLFLGNDNKSITFSIK